MLLTNTYRQKLLNAILYFVPKVKNPTKVKIFKLLYFLDFKHFKETGRSVTNLDYYALDYGPVPLELLSQINDNKLPKDFADALVMTPFGSEESGKKGVVFGAKRKPDMSVFTPREKKILEEMAFVFRDVDAKQISDISHFHNQPWHRTRKEKGENARIDYALAIDKDAEVSLEDALESVRERKEMLKNFPPLKEI